MFVFVDINSFNSRRLDVIKEVYGALLKISAEFARNDYSNEQISIFLTGLIAPRVCLYQEYYVKNKMKLRIILGNIGTHLPHITDVKWKIDFVVKVCKTLIFFLIMVSCKYFLQSSNLNECDGPVFRITLLTDVSNELDGKKIEEVNFTCDSRELQDLVYKLKDAVRHCQKIRLEH